MLQLSSRDKVFPAASALSINFYQNKKKPRRDSGLKCALPCAARCHLISKVTDVVDVSIKLIIDFNTGSHPAIPVAVFLAATNMQPSVFFSVLPP